MRLSYSLFIFLFYFSCALAEHPDLQPFIVQWKSELIEVHGFVEEKDCNWQNAEKRNEIILGLPDSLVISFADMNEDGKTDALGTISPIQCDGGNGAMNFQFALIVLSSPEGYGSFRDVPSLNLGLGGSFFHLNKAETGGIKATYYEYLEDDGRCCPSIKRDLLLEISDNTIKYN